MPDKAQDSAEQLPSSMVYRDAEGRPHLPERKEKAAAAAQRERREKGYAPPCRSKDMDAILVNRT